MASIQEKMESLRQQKLLYAAAPSGKLKTSSLRSRHPPLPLKKKSSFPSSATSLVKATPKNSTSTLPKVASSVPSSSAPTKERSPLPTSSSRPRVHSGRTLLHQEQRKENDTTKATSSEAIILKKETNGDIEGGGMGILEEESRRGSRSEVLDPLQSCYGSRNRISQLKTKEETPLKGILTPPSSPCSSSSSSRKKKKKVTFSKNIQSSSPTSSSSSSLSSSSGRPMRPSLSDQLSAIAEKAGGVTAEIKSQDASRKENKQDNNSVPCNSRRSQEVPLLSTPLKNFTIGPLQCRYPAPAEFFSDRLEYKFHHPYENSEILMILYYKDLVSTSLSASPPPGKLIFRVPRRLVHFAADYDPNRHYVVLFLSSTSDFLFVRKNVLPKINYK